VGVACDLGYPCAKFRLPRPFGFRVRADVRDIRQTDGQTDDRRRWPPNAPPPLRGRGHNKGDDDIRWWLRLKVIIMVPIWKRVGLTPIWSSFPNAHYFHTHIILIIYYFLVIQWSPSHRGIDSDGINWNQIRPYLIFLTRSSNCTLWNGLDFDNKYLRFGPIYTDLVRFSSIWSDLVIRVTRKRKRPPRPKFHGGGNVGHRWQRPLSQA